MESPFQQLIVKIDAVCSKSICPPIVAYAINASAGDVLSNIHKARVEIIREGGRPDVCFLPTSKYEELCKVLAGAIVHCQVQHDSGAYTCEGISLHTPYGEITVMEDNITAEGYLMQFDTWRGELQKTLCSNPKFTRVLYFSEHSYSQRLNSVLVAPIKCQCGAQAVHSTVHSAWCALF